MSTSKNAVHSAAQAEPCLNQANTVQILAIERAMAFAVNSVIASLRTACVQHMQVDEWDDIDTHVDNAMELAIDQLKRSRGICPIDHMQFFRDWDKAASTINLIARSYPVQRSRFHRSLQSVLQLFSVQSDAVEHAWQHYLDMAGGRFRNGTKP